MADETTAEKPSELTDDQHAQYLANRERFAAQASYDLDPRLHMLLGTVFSERLDHKDNSIDLVVVVDGTTIAGTVVSEEVWVERQHAQIRSSNEFLAEALGFAEAGWDELKARMEEESKANPLLKKRRRYIHFLEPVLLTGGSHIKMQATRVDLRNVSAWSIGKLPED